MHRKLFACELVLWSYTLNKGFVACPHFVQVDDFGFTSSDLQCSGSVYETAPLSPADACDNDTFQMSSDDVNWYFDAYIDFAALGDPWIILEGVVIFSSKSDCAEDVRSVYGVCVVLLM